MHVRPVRIGLATMEGRQECLHATLSTLVTQGAAIFVYLNEVRKPSWARDFPSVTWTEGVDLGDAGKFHFAKSFSGVYLTCDDDILYPPDHVEILARFVAETPRAAYSWHGSNLRSCFTHYYAQQSREVFPYYGEVPSLTRVDVLGTGAAAFDSTVLNRAPSLARRRGVVDIAVSIALKRDGIFRFVIPHAAGRMRPVPGWERRESISSSSRRADGSRMDLAVAATQLIYEHGPWLCGDLPPAPGSSETRHTHP